MAALKRRNIGAEILEGLRQLKRGEHGRMTTMPSVVTIREDTGLSSRGLPNSSGLGPDASGVGTGTPRAVGAALTLLMIAAKNPRALIEVA